MEQREANGERQRAKPCILCIGCGNELCLLDKRNCWRKKIRTIKKSVEGHRWSFSSCRFCCHKLAAEEAVCCAGTEITLEADGVETFEGKNLDDIDVRCNFCLALMTNAEKHRHKELLIPFLQRRLIWRGICFECNDAGEI